MRRISWAELEIGNHNPRKLLRKGIEQMVRESLEDASIPLERTNEEMFNKVVDKHVDTIIAFRKKRYWLPSERYHPPGTNFGYVYVKGKGYVLANE